MVKHKLCDYINILMFILMVRLFYGIYVKLHLLFQLSWKWTVVRI